MFQFDPALYRMAFEEQGWVHVSDRADQEFLEHLRAEPASEGALGGATGPVLEGTGIRGAKSQFLYEPHPDLDLRAELGAMTTVVCGLEPASFTVAERHIKAYEVGADPGPAGAQGPSVVAGVGGRIHRGARGLDARALPARRRRREPVPHD
jgi:hypothetical protein